MKLGKITIASFLFMVGIGAAVAAPMTCTCEGTSTITRGDNGEVIVECEGTLTCQL